LKTAVYDDDDDEGKVLIVLGLGRLGGSGKNKKKQ